MKIEREDIQKATPVAIALITAYDGGRHLDTKSAQALFSDVVQEKINGLSITEIVALVVALTEISWAGVQMFMRPEIVPREEGDEWSLLDVLGVIEAAIVEPKEDEEDA